MLQVTCNENFYYRALTARILTLSLREVSHTHKYMYKHVYLSCSCHQCKSRSTVSSHHKFTKRSFQNLFTHGELLAYVDRNGIRQDQLTICFRDTNSRYIDQNIPTEQLPPFFPQPSLLTPQPPVPSPQPNTKLCCHQNPLQNYSANTYNRYNRNTIAQYTSPTPPILHIRLNLSFLSCLTFLFTRRH